MNFNEFLEKEALSFKDTVTFDKDVLFQDENQTEHLLSCLLYTSPSPRDRTRSRMPSSA